MQNGPPRSGQTSILLACAARYVASTSNIFLEDGDKLSPATINENSTSPRSVSDFVGPIKRQKSNPSEPRVVILDIEHGVNAVSLILAVRDAVLRRWEETSLAREWKRKQQQVWRANVNEGCGESTCVNEDAANDNGDEVTMSKEEQCHIERAIASCLGRIHIVQPRDFTYLSLVATLESLRQCLDLERVQKSLSFGSPTKQQQTQRFGQLTKPTATNTNQTDDAPTLILIDSLSTLEASTKVQESLPTASGSKSGGSGLSERNEFYRQLVRLRDEHEMAIIGTSRIAPMPTSGSSTRGGQGRMGHGGSSIWDRMVSQRVSLHHVVEGTQECQAGYDFVATVGNQGDAEVFPYSIAAGGIVC
jgi:hypothetical protein